LNSLGTNRVNKALELFGFNLRKLLGFSDFKPVELLLVVNLGVLASGCLNWEDFFLFLVFE
jgi:hypothetical protein